MWTYQSSALLPPLTLLLLPQEIKPLDQKHLRKKREGRKSIDHKPGGREQCKSDIYTKMVRDGCSWDHEMLRAIVRSLKMTDKKQLKLRPKRHMIHLPGIKYSTCTPERLAKGTAGWPNPCWHLDHWASSSLQHLWSLRTHKVKQLAWTYAWCRQKGSKANHKLYILWCSATPWSNWQKTWAQALSQKYFLIEPSLPSFCSGSSQGFTHCYNQKTISTCIQ